MEQCAGPSDIVRYRSRPKCRVHCRLAVSVETVRKLPRLRVAARKVRVVDLLGKEVVEDRTGVAKEITSCGIFPATEPDDVSQLESWKEASSNYKSVDEAVELSGAEVDRLIEKGMP